MDRLQGSCCRVGDRDQTDSSHKSLLLFLVSYWEETGAPWEGAGQQHFEGCSTD